MSYFITKSNFLRIIRRVKLSEEQLKGEIYKNQIYIFNKLERENILSVKQFLINAQNGIIEFTKSDLIEDTFSYVHEYSRYAKYHLNKSCEALISNFKDFEIPIEIKYKASGVIDRDRVTLYREWFKQQEIQNLLLNNKQKFLDKLEIKFNLQNPPKLIEIPSKGIQSITSLSLNELENKIDELIIESNIFCDSSEKYSKILNGENFKTKTYLVTSKKHRLKPIDINNTGFSEEEVREVLLDYHYKIKKPLIDFLLDYWIIKINGGLDFEKNIMEQLEFQPCSKCVKTNIVDTLNIDIDDSDDSF